MAGTSESPPRSARGVLVTWAGYRIGWVEIAFLLCIAGMAIAQFSEASLLAQLGLLVLSLPLGAACLIKGIRAFLPQLLWRLRNRLILAYAVAALPIVILLLLAAQGAYFLGGQVVVYLVDTELLRQLNALTGAAHTIVRAPPEGRAVTLERVEVILRERFPRLQVIVSDPGTVQPDGPPRAWGEMSGFVLKEGFLYAWTRAVEGERQVTLLVPLTRHWLAELAPGLGPVGLVSLDPGSPRMRTHRPPSGDDDEPLPIPPAANRFDIELLWGNEVRVAIWESPQRLERAILGVRSRLSALLRLLFVHTTELPDVFYFLAGLFVLIEILSLIIGVSVTRAITGAVHDLYEGTERVMQGDFSHRIRVHGNEQVAGLSRSFNRMTENIEHLLVISKEKERMQAELEIAREVQNQLFPRAVPEMKRLHLRAHCSPARMVSGDYYDYQSLGNGKIALAVGDVAGKGISAALLMASLQSSLRSQVRHYSESAGVISPALIVSRINLQLYADTAPEKFATFFFAVYDDDSGLLTYTNAGHLPPLLVRCGEVTPLEINGMVVGAFPFATYTESSLSLEPGDRLVCYTDGIVEPENEFGEMFGDQRLQEMILKLDDLDGEQLIVSVTEAVQRHTGSPELQDDLTLVIARRV